MAIGLDDMTRDRAFLEGLAAGYRFEITPRSSEAKRAFPADFGAGFDLGSEMRQVKDTALHVGDPADPEVAQGMVESLR